METMSSEGNRSNREPKLGNIGHIRVYVRPRDVPRWNRIFERSGKSNNPALLEWMMQLAEERLNLNADQSRLEWSREMRRIENGDHHRDATHEEETASDPGDAHEDGETDLGQTLEINGDRKSSDSLPSSHHWWGGMTRTVENVSDRAVAEGAVADARINHSDHVREKEAQRAVSIVNVTEQITVEKKGSNAPIRKRFRLRVSTAPSATSDIATVSEAVPQTFREPLKVRRKQGKNVVSGATHILLQAMTLRSREKAPAVTNGQPKKNSKPKPDSDTVAANEGLTLMTINHEASRVSIDAEPIDPPEAPPRASRLSTRINRGAKDPEEELQTFNCSQCPRVFKNATSHSRHERAHKKPTEHTCDSCDKKFTTGGSLWHHKKTQHEEKHIECPHCDQKFAVKRFLRLHLRKHTGEKPYRCKYCDIGFSLKSTLRNHEPTHLDHKHFLCDICGQSFRRKDNLNQHVARRHGRITVYECNICSKKFNQASSLANHQIHHQNKENGAAPYKCDLCGKRFTTPNGQRHHMSLHRMRKDHICETCGKVFKMKYYLTKHQAIHLKVKPHICTICEKGFTQKSNLDIHMRTHTGIKPYSCKICRKAFAHNVSLKGHVASCHSGSGDAEKLYSCKVCGKRFAHNVSLKGHVASCHSDSGDAGKLTKDTASTGSRTSPQKKQKRSSSLPERNPAPGVAGSTRVNINYTNADGSSESQAMNLPTAAAGEAAVMTLRGLANGGLPLVEQGDLEETIQRERKEGILDSTNLVIDEEQYHQDLPDLDNSLSAANCPVENPRSSISVVGMPQDISYNLPGFLPQSSQVSTDKVQYVTAIAVSREVPQSRSSSRPDDLMSQSNGLEAHPPHPPSPSMPHHSHQQQLDHLVYASNHHIHPSNLVTYSRQPIGSPSVNQQAASSPLIQHQDHGLHPPPPLPEQNRIGQHLTADVSTHENLSPQTIVQQNDPVSPGLHQGIQVDSNIHQAQTSNYPPQNINFIPSFHPQPQPLTLTAQSAPLLPNMIRKEQQQLLVEGFPQNLAAMLPFRTTAAQMVQDQRLNLQAGNLQSPNQPVHLPFRYIEYSQSLGETAPSPHDRGNNLPTSALHFGKAQTNLPPSRMTPSLQAFSYNSNFSPGVSATMVEQQQARATPSFVGGTTGQRSTAFVNSSQIDGVKEVNSSLVQGGDGNGGWKQSSDIRWEASHLHQMPVGQGRGDMVNIPPQLHRQLLSEYRKMMPYHAAVMSSQSQQQIWEHTGSQQ